LDICRYWLKSTVPSTRRRSRGKQRENSIID
jgi:hypothetical protein